jgi:hypothetical protein
VHDVDDELISQYEFYIDKDNYYLDDRAVEFMDEMDYLIVKD